MQVPLNPITLLPRVSRLLDSAEQVIVRFNTVLDGLDEAVTQIQGVMERAKVTEQSARMLVDDATGLRRRVEAALDEYEPALRDAAPILPSLHSVGPDLTDLLAVSRGLNELMGSLPGLGKAKRRMDEQLSAEADADETS